VAAGAVLAPALGETPRAAARSEPASPAVPAPLIPTAAEAVPPPQAAFLDDNPRWVVKPFPLHQVSLLGGTVFAEKRDRVLRYAAAYPADRVLHNFRVTAGLPTPPGSAPPGGWDDATGNLRGHFSGHLTTLFAQAYAATGQAQYKDKLDLIVSVLGDCQQAMAGRFSHPGFLAAYPETQFVQLEQFATYPTIWAPYYTCHKIMRGLLDSYLLTGNQQALAIVTAMGDWVHSRLSRLSRQTLNRMWAIYIAGEFGAMNEVMADLYALTGQERYLATATYFDNREALFGACLANTDILTRLHANTHVPQFLGYLRVFDQNGQPDYHTATENFFGMVVPHRMFSHGGTSGTWPAASGLPANTNPELFQPRDYIARAIGGSGSETCTTYNLLRVARNLFFHDPDPAYLDYYERGLVNHILGSRRDAESTSSPNVTYFVPLSPGNVRGFGNIGTCCGGTGLENHTKYQESIYFRSADNAALYVNLYIGSILSWPERGVTVTQTGDFPRQQESTITITGQANLALNLRVPGWAKNFQVRVNGAPHSGPVVPGTFLRLERAWRTGDTVQVTMPFPLRVEKALDNPAIQSVFHGPVLLPAVSGQTSFRDVSLYRHLGLDGDLARAFQPAGPPSHFTSNGLTFRPLYVGDTQAHHPYVRRNEPTVVFGSRNSGVPNRARSDGTTFLDAVWARAPFPSSTEFIQAVQSTADEWRSRGLLSWSERRAVLSAARNANLS
jgi:hypothetical protein